LGRLTAIRESCGYSSTARWSVGKRRPRAPFGRWTPIRIRISLGSTTSGTQALIGFLAEAEIRDDALNFGYPKPEDFSSPVTLERVTSIAPGSWFMLNGKDFSTLNVGWDEFYAVGKVPLTLGGISVKINNKDTGLYWVDQGRTIALAPSDDAVVPGVPVIVTNAFGTIQPSVELRPFKPELFFYEKDGKKYLLRDGPILGQKRIFGPDEQAPVPVIAGQTITLFGTGFGPTSPVAPTDRLLPQELDFLLADPTLLKIYVAGAECQFTAKLAQVGIYRFDVQIPDYLSEGEWEVEFEIGGERTQGGLLLAIKPPPPPE
jgi:uncharacterized protein (TIGR03437 family)